MADERSVGACGGLFNNDTILWFIILFLLLFCNWGFGGAII
jgi:hypothetical protein